MKRVAPLLTVVLLAGVFLPAAQADVYTVRRQGGTIVPEKSEDISMDAEDVRIEPNDDGYQVTAIFVMRNHANRQIDSLVAFPILGSRFSFLDISREFQVHIKMEGESDSAFQPAKVELKQGPLQKAKDDYFVTDPPKTVGDYPEAAVWNVTWTPKQTKVIRVRFDMGEPMVLPGSNQLVGGWQLTYVVTTGTLWKGPIGRADISMRFTRNSLPGWTPLGSFQRISYPESAKWSGNDAVTWHFENWTPKEEICVRSVHWAGLQIEEVAHYPFSLPAEYRGAQMEYDESTVEALVTRDLKLAIEYLPAEVQTFDHNLLRIVVADWLLHEIYARHGDSFYLEAVMNLASNKLYGGKGL